MLNFRDFPPHMQLLLLCARARHSQAESAQIQALIVSPMDWPAFLRTATHHKLGPLCFATLDRLRPTGLPPEVRSELQQQATTNAFEALRSTDAVSRVCDLFGAAGYPLTVLKGVPLSQLLFGSPHARHVGDLDLLTTPRNLAEQIELLAQAGYERTNPACRLTPARIGSFSSFWKDFTFRNLSNGFELDLHWRLFNNRHHRANPLAAEAQFAIAAPFNVPMQVLPPVDQFLYVAAHGTSDAWLYLKSLADVAAFLHLLTPGELDAALARAESLRLLEQIGSAIHLSNDWFGTTASSPRLLPANNRVRRRTEAALLRHDFRPLRSQTSSYGWLTLELGLVPGLRSIVEMLGRYVWRPRVWTRLDLPDHLFWIYPIAGLLLLPRTHPVESSQLMTHDS